MKEPFFADINWTKLENKMLDPPIVLRKSRTSAEELALAQANQEQDELAMLFEHPDNAQDDDDDGFDDEQRGGGQRTLLSDQDYTEENRTYNRVKNYSFARV